MSTAVGGDTVGVLNIIVRAQDAFSNVFKKFGDTVLSASRRVRESFRDTRKETEDTRGGLNRLSNAFDGFGRTVDKVNANLGVLGTRFALVLAAIVPVTTALLGLGGSLVSIVASASQAAVALGGTLVAGIEQLLGTLSLLTVAFARVKEVLALNEEQEKLTERATQDATAALDRQRAAAHNLENAQYSLRNAYRAVDDARRDSIRQIQDMTLAQRAARLEAEASALASLDAQEKFYRATRTGGALDVARARISRGQSDIGHQSAQTALQRAVEDQRRIAREGVENSRQVEQALRNLTEAQYALAQAQQEVTRSTKDEFSSQALLNKQVNELTSIERAFGASAARLKDTFKDITAPLTDTILASFTRVTDGLEKILQSPTLARPFENLSRGISQGVDTLFRGFSTPDNLRNIGKIIDMAAKNVPIVARGASALFTFLNRIAVAAGPLLADILTTLANLLEQINDSVSDSELSAFFESLRPALVAVADLLASVAGIIKELFTAVAPVGTALIQDLAEEARKFTNFLKSNRDEVREFFERAADVVRILAAGLVQVAIALGSAFEPETIESLSRILNDVVLPAFYIFIQVMKTILQLLAELLDIPFVAEFLQFSLVLGGLLLIFGRFAGLVGVISTVLGGLLTVLSTVFALIVAFLSRLIVFSISHPFIAAIVLATTLIITLTDNWGDLIDTVVSFLRTIAGIPRAIYDAIAGIPDALASAGQWFIDFGASIVNWIVDGLTSLPGRIAGFIRDEVTGGLRSIGNALIPFGDPFASGGMVGGPPGAGDVVPAWLSPGEVVLNERQQAMVGEHRIRHALRRTGGRNANAYAAGGYEDGSANGKRRLRKPRGPLSGAPSEITPAQYITNNTATGALGIREYFPAGWEQAAFLSGITDRDERALAYMVATQQLHIGRSGSYLARDRNYDLAILQAYAEKAFESGDFGGRGQSNPWLDANTIDALRQSVRTGVRGARPAPPTNPVSGVGLDRPRRPGEEPGEERRIEGPSLPELRVSATLPGGITATVSTAAPAQRDETFKEYFRRKTGNRVGSSQTKFLEKYYRLTYAAERNQRTVPGQPQPAALGGAVAGWMRPVPSGTARGGPNQGTHSRGERGYVWQDDDAYDIFGADGALVVAPAAGTVGRISPFNSDSRFWGHGLYLNANGVEMFFKHLKSVAVREGQQVNIGQELGVLGEGVNGGPHLHFATKPLSALDAIVNGSRTVPVAGDPSAQATVDPNTDHSNNTPDQNRALGRQMAAEFGWTGAEWDALERLWTNESGWRHRVSNYEGSGAYGIPQSLPADKMASEGADYLTNPATQIRWGLKYIKNRPDYGSPSRALAKWQSRSPHWYATGGEVPGADGKPVPIVAHEGEMILNDKQQERLGGKAFLRKLFGFRPDRGGHFQRGGEPAFNYGLWGRLLTQRGTAAPSMIERLLLGQPQTPSERAGEATADLGRLQPSLFGRAIREAGAKATAQVIAFRDAYLKVISAIGGSLETLREEVEQEETNFNNRLNFLSFRFDRQGRAEETIQVIGRSERTLAFIDDQRKRLIDENALILRGIQNNDRVLLRARAALRDAIEREDRNGINAAKALIEEATAQGRQDRNRLAAGRGRLGDLAQRAIQAASERRAGIIERLTNPGGPNRPTTAERTGRIDRAISLLEQSDVEGSNDQAIVDLMRDRRDIIKETNQRFRERLRIERNKKTKDQDPELIRELTRLLQDGIEDLQEAQIAIINRQREDFREAVQREQAVFDRQQGGVERSRTVATLVGDRGGILRSFGAEEAVLRARQSFLTSALAQANASGDTAFAQEISDLIEGVNVQLVDNLANRFQTISDLIDRDARRAESRLGSLQRMADAGTALASGGAFSTDYFTRAQTLAGQGGALQFELAGAQAVLADLERNGLGASEQAESLRDEIFELTAAIYENTLAQKENTTEAIQALSAFYDTQFGKQLDAISIEEQIAAISGENFGPNREAQLASAQVRTGVLLGKRSSIEDLLTRALLAGDLGLAQDYITALRQNYLELLQNNKLISTLNGTLAEPQTFSSEAWDRFRIAIFDGMNNLLPQFQIPQLASGGYVERGGLALLHPAEVVTGPEGLARFFGKTGAGGDTHLHLTSPVEVFDPRSAAEQFAWEFNRRRD